MGVALLSAIVRLDDDRDRTPVVACPSSVRSGRFRAPIIINNVGGGEKRFRRRKGNRNRPFDEDPPLPIMPR